MVIVPPWFSSGLCKLSTISLQNRLNWITFIAIRNAGFFPDPYRLRFPHNHGVNMAKLTKPPGLFAASPGHGGLKTNHLILSWVDLTGDVFWSGAADRRPARSGCGYPGKDRNSADGLDRPQ